MKILLISPIYLFVFSITILQAQAPLSTPLYQTPKEQRKAAKKELTLWDISRNDRWLGQSPQNIRWAVDGSGIYFQWTSNPLANPLQELDPWYKTTASGETVMQIPAEEIHLIPGPQVSWDELAERAAWVSDGRLYLYDSTVRPIVSLDRPISNPYFRDGALFFMAADGALFKFNLTSGALHQITTTKRVVPAKPNEAENWLQKQQLDLFEDLRQEQANTHIIAEHSRRTSFPSPIPIPLQAGWTIDRIELAPGSKYIIYSSSKNNLNQHTTRYMDYAGNSGYSTTHQARAKVGEPFNAYKMEIAQYDPRQDPDSLRVIEVDASDLTSDEVVFHGPYWNPGGTRALVQLSSTKHKDRWIAELDIETGKFRQLIHDHDDAWLGGPNVVGYYSINPVLLEWVSEDQFVFGSERTGFSHLYLSDLSGNINALTEGAWEVREAELSRDRKKWLITAGKEDPCQDHLYTLPAKGGELKQLSTQTGRNTGLLSPDGRQVALIHSFSTAMPDLYLHNLDMHSTKRITVTGTPNYYQTDLVTPEIVSFPHPDGKPVWAALFKPRNPNPQKPAILHIHGGGYRQFSHKGWSVYGYSKHLSLINYLVQEGYTVLDLDYRGSAGFGRDYRTDIYRSMGVKDIESGLAAIDYLVEEHDIDPKRIGVYGISYGGFFTLSALFKHPGKFAAGVANAAVADWAHYNHLWTSRILNLPYEDPEAYKISSPINHAAGLQDPLLILHGIIDDNVHFQDAVRVSQKLIELGKDFEIMYYPQERHVIQKEAARFDYHKRLVEFFGWYLLR